jgi:hypothetical protein
MIIVSVDAAAVVQRYTYVRPDGSRRIFSDPFLDGGGNKLGGLARRRYAAVHVGIARATVSSGQPTGPAHGERHSGDLPRSHVKQILLSGRGTKRRGRVLFRWESCIRKREEKAGRAMCLAFASQSCRRGNRTSCVTSVGKEYGGYTIRMTSVT